MQCSSESNDFSLGNEKSASHHDIRVKCNLSFYCEQKRSRWPSQRLFCVQAWSSLFSKESPTLEDARLRVHLLTTNLTQSHKPTNTQTHKQQQSRHTTYIATPKRGRQGQLVFISMLDDQTHQRFKTLILQSKTMPNTDIRNQTHVST